MHEKVAKKHSWLFPTYYPEAPVCVVTSAPSLPERIGKHIITIGSCYDGLFIVICHFVMVHDMVDDKMLRSECDRLLASVVTED